MFYVETVHHRADSFFGIQQLIMYVYIYIYDVTTYNTTTVYPRVKAINLLSHTDAAEKCI